MQKKYLITKVFLFSIPLLYLGFVVPVRAELNADGFSFTHSLNEKDESDQINHGVENQNQLNPLSGSPFDCSPNFYQFLSGHLHVLNPDTGGYEPIGRAPRFTINGAGYNPADNFIYATARGYGYDSTGRRINDMDFIRIDSRGNIYKISSVSVGSQKNAGDIYNGKLWAKDKIIGSQSSKLYVFDLATGSSRVVTTDRPFPNAADFALIGSTFYGGYLDGRLIRIDLSQSPPKVTSAMVTGLPKQNYGSAYTTNNTDLYLSSNSGGLYKIEDYDSASPTAIFANNSVPTAKNDGASCPSAAPPFPPPGPEPTPEPTATPEPPPTPPPSPPSCNNYMITGVANDPDQPGSPLTVSLLIDGVLIGSTTSSGGRFSMPIHDEYKDDYLHTVTVSVNNPYSSQVWVSTGWDHLGNPTGYWSWQNNPSYAYVDFAAFRCLPPETDLATEGEAWAQKPGRSGSYPNGDVAVEKIWLEDTAEFEVKIENKHPIFPAINPKVLVVLPEDPDGVLDWDLTFHTDWFCNQVQREITCTRDRFESGYTGNKYGTGESNYTLITGTSIVPGTFLPDELKWTSEISSETTEISPNDNTAEFDLKVVKSWNQPVSSSELISLYTHGIYHESVADRLVDSVAEKSYEPNDVIASIFQAPIYMVPAISLSAYPTLIAEFCTIYSEPNCANDSAKIEGSVRINSYSYSETIAQKLVGGSLVTDPTAVNLQDSTVTIDYGLSAGGRFVDENPVHCQEWMTKMGSVGDDSECAAFYEVYSGFDSSTKANYAWDKAELYGLLVYSRGGRPVECDLDGDHCIVDPQGKPGIYRISGNLDYEVIFFDDVYRRLGDDPLYFPSTIPFSIFNQQVAPFQEQD